MKESYPLKKEHVTENQLQNERREKSWRKVAPTYDIESKFNYSLDRNRYRGPEVTCPSGEHLRNRFHATPLTWGEGGVVEALGTRDYTRH